jgi:ligand-binding SRPBCC domain-containing protein
VSGGSPIEISPVGGGAFRLETETLLRRPVDEVFSFFADARNLEALTPPWLRFRIVTPGAIELSAGTTIDYRLRVHGLPVVWRSEITDWSPPHRFVDVQVRGPYRRWVHEHTFVEHEFGTLARDVVDYAVPGGRLANDLFVMRDLRRIFDYRRRALAVRFAQKA